MDDSTFDQFTRLAAPSRRALVQTIGAAAVAMTGLTALSGFDAAEAKKRGSKGEASPLQAEAFWDSVYVQ